MFEQWEKVRRLLLVFGESGDSVLDDLRPALSRLYAALPGVHLALWTAPRLREAASALPGVGAVLTFPTAWLEEIERVVATIAEGQYDAALLFSPPGGSPFGAAYACYLAGVPVRLGQSAEFGGAVLSHRVIPASPTLPPAEHYLYLVSQVVDSRVVG